MQTQILKANEADEYYFDEGCFILELSNSPADPGVSIARARVKAISIYTSPPEKWHSTS